MYLNEIFDKNHLLNRYKKILVISGTILLSSIFICHLDETVIADGTIRPEESTLNIKTLKNGFIKDVFYKNSQFINKGAILFCQEASVEEESLKNLKKLECSYEKELVFINELSNLLEKTTIEYCKYDSAFIQKNAKYSSFVNQYKNLHSELVNKKNYYERQLVLYPEIISKQELENIEFDLLQSKLSFSSWLEDQKIKVFEEMNSYSQLLEECQLNIFQAQKAINNATTKTTISGYINEITKISPGDYVTEGEIILSVIPNNSNLKCILNVSNSHISKIKIGQSVLLQIEDLPFTKYGKIQGTVCLIPQDSIISEKSYFPVEVLLDKNFVEAKKLFKKEKIFIKVGSKVTGKIIVDSNTVFEKILEKVVLHDK